MGLFSTVPGCSWLYLTVPAITGCTLVCHDIPFHRMPHTATDLPKCFCIYRLKCSEAGRMVGYMITPILRAPAMIIRIMLMHARLGKGVHWEVFLHQQQHIDKKKSTLFSILVFTDLHDMNFDILTELLPPYEMEWIRIRISHFRANLNIMHLAHFGGLDWAGGILAGCE